MNTAMHAAIDDYLALEALDAKPWEMDGVRTTLADALQHESVRDAEVLLLVHCRATVSVTLHGCASTDAAIDEARALLFGAQAGAALFARTADGRVQAFELDWSLAPLVSPQETGDPTTPARVSAARPKRTRALRRAVSRCGEPFGDQWDHRVEFRDGLVPLEALDAHDARYAILGWSADERAVTVDLLGDLGGLPEAITRNVWRSHQWIGVWDLAMNAAVDPSLAATLIPIALGPSARSDAGAMAGRTVTSSAGISLVVPDRSATGGPPALPLPVDGGPRVEIDRQHLPRTAGAPAGADGFGDPPESVRATGASRVLRDEMGADTPPHITVPSSQAHRHRR